MNAFRCQYVKNALVFILNFLSFLLGAHQVELKLPPTPVTFKKVSGMNAGIFGYSWRGFLDLQKRGIGASLFSEAKAMHQYFYVLPLFTRKKKRLPNKSNKNYESTLR